jgi:poly-gamma-glutamate system protein
MKKMYWTNYNVHPYLMVGLAIVSLFCLYVVETNKSSVPSSNYELKLQATLEAQKAFAALKKARLAKGIGINSRFDPSKSGLIGKERSIITSDQGVLRSKQISLNPNLAALFVQWLSDLKLKPGETITVGMTGSFPALDASMLAAINAMQLKPIIIVSGTASQYGANIPNFSWLDMLNDLNNAKIFSYKPIAASIGAAKDRGEDLKPEGVQLMEKTIKKYDIPLIKEPLVSQSIDKRLELYKQAAGDNVIRAYINIGGGVASVGKHFAKPKLTSEERQDILSHSLKSGPNLSLPIALANTNSVAIRYLKRGIPVINVKNINVIAAEYDLKAWSNNMGIGIGPLFYTKLYNIWYALISLFVIMGACWALVKIQVIQKREQAGEMHL